MAMSLLPLREARPLDFTPREGCRSYGYVLKTSRNLFLGIQVAELQKYSQVNFMAAIAALVYMAVEITLLLLHCLRVRNFYTGGDPDAWEHVFHFSRHISTVVELHLALFVFLSYSGLLWSTLFF